MWSKIILVVFFLMFNCAWGKSSLLQCAPEEFFQASESSECEPLAVGKSRRVRGYSASSGISVKDHYMQRTEANKYQIFLNINFIQGQTGKMNPSEMMERVKGCLLSAAPNLRGPDGSTLQINALNPDEAKELPKKLDPVDITIESGLRANAEMYTDELNCGEITHEVLHLLGLCDEYKEPLLVAGNTYACRVVPEVTTIMKNPRAVYARASDVEITCKCDDDCQKVMSSSNQNLKNIFLAPDIYDAIDVDFRTTYCKPATNVLDVLETKSLSSYPDRAMILKSSDDLSFVAEHRAVHHVSQTVYLQNMSCTCPADDQVCLSKKLAIQETIAKPSAIRTSCPAYTGTENYSVKVDKEGGRVENGKLILSRKGSGESFLYPNHWDKILAGSCESKASSYNECATTAYKSTDCKDFKQCTDEYFLGIKK